MRPPTTSPTCAQDRARASARDSAPLIHSVADGSGTATAPRLWDDSRGATGEKGAQQQTVTGSGQPADRTDLGFGVTDEVTEVLVKEGDTVTAGQALARVDDTLLQAQLTAANARQKATHQS